MRGAQAGRLQVAVEEVVHIMDILKSHQVQHVPQVIPKVVVKVLVQAKQVMYQM